MQGGNYLRSLTWRAWQGKSGDNKWHAVRGVSVVTFVLTLSPNRGRRGKRERRCQIFLVRH